MPSWLPSASRSRRASTTTSARSWAPSRSAPASTARGLRWDVRGLAARRPSRPSRRPRFWSSSPPTR
eukprot:7461149-Pyramimonas_sp.AAC.1